MERLHTRWIVVAVVLCVGVLLPFICDAAAMASDLETKVSALEAEIKSLKWTPPAQVALDKDPAGDLARFVVNTKYEDLPADVVEVAKKEIFDTIAATIGGSGWEASPKIAQLAAEMGGTPQASIFMYGGKVSLPTAAFAFGCMARAIDIGSVHALGTHVGEWILPALLPVAEWKGHVTGKELITAYAVSAEVITRIVAAAVAGKQSASPRAQKMVPGEFTGVFGAAAGVAKLLDCTVEETWNAMGIGWSSASYGNFSYEGDQMPRVQHSFKAQAGMQAVLLAKRGATGPKGIFLGPRGMFSHEFDWDTKPELISEGLGKKWLYVDGLNLKPYATSLGYHSVADSTIELVKEHNISYRDIQSIHCTVSVWTGRDWTGQNMYPATVPAAMYDLRYIVATAAIKGTLFLDAYTKEEMSRADKRELWNKITITVDAGLPMFRNHVVKITLKDGTTYSKQNEYVKGTFPQKPMTWDDLHAKYQSCISYAAEDLAPSQYEQVEKMCRDLENVSNASIILSTLTKK